MVTTSSLGSLLSAHWPAIERHPRLVFDYIGAAEAAMIRYYIERGEPFSVVIR